MDETVGVHFGVSRGAHAVSAREVARGEPGVGDAGVDGIGEHLRKVRLDEGGWIVDDVIEEAVGSLVSEASIEEVARETSEACAIRAAVGWKGAQDASQSDSGPAIASAPEAGIVELSAAVVPDVGKELLARVVEADAESVNLGKGFIVVAHGGEEGGSSIESVGPDLGCIDEVIEEAVGAARSFVTDPVEEAVDGCAESGITGPGSGLGIGCAAHGGIGRSAGDDDTEASVGSALDEGGAGEEEDLLAVAGFKKCLGKDTLFPIAALEGEGRSGSFGDARLDFGRRALRRRGLSRGVRDCR